MSDMTQQNVQFKDNTAASSVDIGSGSEPTYQMGRMDPASLGQFLARPVRIYKATWSVGTKLYDNFNPWFLFFNDPAVIQKWNHFAYMRCTLKVKCVLAGTPFHYGKGMVNYVPFVTYDDYFGGVTSQDDLVPASQTPHFFTNPTESAGGEISLPFFYHKNYWTMKNLEFSDMGNLFISSFNTLKHAQNGTDPVEYVFYAWAENVELIVPTSYDYSPVTASGPLSRLSKHINIRKEAGGDEYGKGIISKPLTALANVASTLSAVPWLSPYAMATQQLASGSARLASLFGFCRPAILSALQFYKPSYGGKLAPTDYPETVEKLTVDSKQELTIDQRTVGLAGNKDPMAIATLVQTESYIDTFTWFPSDVEDGLLWNCRVTPSMVRQRSSDSAYFPTMLCYAAMPWKFWRGGIKYRFQIAKSKYHRGRLRIAYDPIEHSPGAGYNQTYSTVIDISQETDFEFVVGWARDAAYLQVEGFTGDNYVVATMSADNELMGDTPFSNGTLRVSVVNPLVEPGDVIQGIEVNVFVSACEDFSFARPWDINVAGLAHFPQTDPPGVDILDVTVGSKRPRVRKEAGESNMEEGTGETLSPEADEPEHAAEKDALIWPNILSDLHKVYMGEQYASFRTMLRRYVHSVTQARALAAGEGEAFSWTSQWFNMPPAPGYNPSLPDGQLRANRMTLLQYLRPIYVGWRGSLRSKYFACDEDGTPQNLAVVLQGENATVDTQTEWSNSQAYTAGQSTDVILGGIAGKYVTPTRLQSVAEVEIPYYSKYRFRLARNTDPGADPFEFSPELLHYVQLRQFAGLGLSDNWRVLIDRYVATGEDFTFFFPLHAPIVYKRTWSYTGATVNPG